jgi:23S rRNA maturation-related 3'-5' exoribonuclease YhaM
MTDFSKVITWSREEIEAKLTEFYNLIPATFGIDSERTNALKIMYQELEPRLRAAPASSQVHYHYASPGGYLFHVMHVIEAAQKVAKLYKELGGVVDATMEEIIFAAMHHDLGKLGDEDGPAYIKETDAYWIKKGYTHKYNEEVQKMSYDDRTLYLLNKYGIKYTKKEMLGMKLADGIFSEANKAYFIAKGVFPMKTSIGYIIHWADWMSAISEKDQQRVLCEGA